MTPAAVVASLSVGRLVARTLRHRGVLHFPLVVVALALLALLFQSTTLAWFAVGYATHLFADSLTKQGVPWFGPLSRKRRGIGPRRLRFSTNSRAEGRLMAVVWMTALVLLLLPLFRPPAPPAVVQHDFSLYLPQVTGGP